MNSHGEMFANLFLDLFLLAAVAGTLSSLGRVCDSMHERERERSSCHGNNYCGGYLCRKNYA